jgi:signal transduction histidine kinase
MALSESLARIRAESEDARVFTAGLAHELRSPVQNLIGETEVALISSRAPGVYREVLQSNLDELRRLGDAVDNLVTICSRNETRATKEREDFDLASEVELRLRRERILAERNELSLELEAHGDTSLRGDREALLRAVRNLAQNAIQWSPPRGSVKVSIEGRSDEVVVCVDDQGPGVPVEMRERIFEPFFRGPSAQGRRLGYGLGLALTKSAVTEHGGRVEVESSPTGGARFTLHLPRHGAPKAA